MDLRKNGKLISRLRKSKGMTQKQVAEFLGIEAKTVSKWETGRGFPDISYLSDLADLFGVSEKILLSGDLTQNTEDIGNMKNTKFYVCPHCGRVVQGVGGCEISCCGKRLEALHAQQTDAEHTLHISETENDFYITLVHEMSKEHFISFLAYVNMDQVLFLRLYPEQDSAVRFPKMFGGSFFFYCSKHGLFEEKVLAEETTKENKGGNLTALLSAFARAYHAENSSHPLFCDHLARKMFSNREYRQIESYLLQSGEDVKNYVNTYLAPTPLARAKFCEESLSTACGSGAEQYVILGSGFDTFALSGLGKLEVFEIDTAEMIAEKCKRIRRAGLEIPKRVHFVSADLSSSGNLEQLLAEQGFEKRKKTFFSCLGLWYYFSKKEIGKLLGCLSKLSAEGSSLVFDFADNHFFSSEVPRVKELRKLAEESGNPMKSCFGYQELEMLLQEHGFLIYEFLNEKEIQRRYFDENHSEITAFEQIHYALAVKKG